MYTGCRNIAFIYNILNENIAGSNIKRTCDTAGTGYTGNIDINSYVLDNHSTVAVTHKTAGSSTGGCYSTDNGKVFDSCSGNLTEETYRAFAGNIKVFNFFAVTVKLTGKLSS